MASSGLVGIEMHIIGRDWSSVCLSVGAALILLTLFGVVLWVVLMFCFATSATLSAWLDILFKIPPGPLMAGILIVWLGYALQNGSNYEVMYDREESEGRDKRECGEAFAEKNAIKASEIQAVHAESGFKHAFDLCVTTSSSSGHDLSANILSAGRPLQNFSAIATTSLGDLRLSPAALLSPQEQPLPQQALRSRRISNKDSELEEELARDGEQPEYLRKNVMGLNEAVSAMATNFDMNNAQVAPDLAEDLYPIESENIGELVHLTSLDKPKSLIAELAELWRSESESYEKSSATSEQARREEAALNDVAIQGSPVSSEKQNQIIARLSDKAVDQFSSQIPVEGQSKTEPNHPSEKETSADSTSISLPKKQKLQRENQRFPVATQTVSFEMRAGSHQIKARLG